MRELGSQALHIALVLPDSNKFLKIFTPWKKISKEGNLCNRHTYTNTHTHTHTLTPWKTEKNLGKNWDMTITYCVLILL